jgi:hypothetical protein
MATYVCLIQFKTRGFAVSRTQRNAGDAAIARNATTRRNPLN